MPMGNCCLLQVLSPYSVRAHKRCLVHMRLQQLLVPAAAFVFVGIQGGNRSAVERLSVSVRSMYVVFLRG